MHAVKTCNATYLSKYAEKCDIVYKFLKVFVDKINKEYVLLIQRIKGQRLIE